MPKMTKKKNYRHRVKQEQAEKKKKKKYSKTIIDKQKINEIFFF